MPDLLLIDDDAGLTELLGDFLRGQGFTVHIARDGLEGTRLFFNCRPDLVVLDVTMPRRDGWEALERIREVSVTPVIMLTARGEEENILRGFALGADDYVTKPFSFAQLSARIKAVLRRVQGDDDDETQLSQGDLKVDLQIKRVWRGDELLHLTPTEFKLLVALMRHAGQPLTTEELVNIVWGPEYADEIGYVRRYIWHLRKKVEPDPEQPCYIHNERGYGYCFQVAEGEQLRNFARDA